MEVPTDKLDEHEAAGQGEHAQQSRLIAHHPDTTYNRDHTEIEHEAAGQGEHAQQSRLIAHHPDTANHRDHTEIENLYTVQASTCAGMCFLAKTNSPSRWNIQCSGQNGHFCLHLPTALFYLITWRCHQFFLGKQSIQ
jgi:hypothetical protein